MLHLSLAGTERKARFGLASDIAFEMRDELGEPVDGDAPTIDDKRSTEASLALTWKPAEVGEYSLWVWVRTELLQEGGARFVVGPARADAHQSTIVRKRRRGRGSLAPFVEAMMPGQDLMASIAMHQKAAGERRAEAAQVWHEE